MSLLILIGIALLIYILTPDQDIEDDRDRN
jgi:hypothetical protein